MLYRCRECTLLRCDTEGQVCEECQRNARAAEEKTAAATVTGCFSTNTLFPYPFYGVSQSTIISTVASWVREIAGDQ